MSPLIVYLFLKLDAVCVFFGVVGGLGLFLMFCVGVALSIVGCTEYEKKYDPVKYKFACSSRKKIMKWGWLFIIPLFIGIMLPTTKEAAVIYVTPKLINAVTTNESLKKIPQNIIDLANAWIEELKPAAHNEPTSTNTQSAKPQGTEK